MRGPIASRLSNLRRPGGERGFSLAEMLAVVAMIGLVAGMGLYIADTASWRVSSAASDLARRLEQSRSKAAFEQHDQVISFDTAAHTFTIHDDDNSDGNVDSAIGEETRVFQLSQSASEVVFGYPTGTKGLDGNNITAAITFAGSPPKVSFNALGVAQSGVVYMVAYEDLQAGDPTKMRAITVNQATGRVRRWRYDTESNGPGPWRLER